MILPLLLSAVDPALDADAALAAIRACAARNQAVSVAIVGPQGEERATLRAADAPPHSMESARRKAYTAASFAQSTADLARLLRDHPDAAGLARLDNTLFVGGGLPLMVKGHSLGGVGVAGSNGPGFDEACARVALARLEAQP
jgi:uncharacterized protein GlcG (DUF336 family)